MGEHLGAVALQGSTFADARPGDEQPDPELELQAASASGNGQQRPAGETATSTGGAAHGGRSYALGLPRIVRMPRRYFIRTFGCQMNEHDSERLAGLLVADGMEPAAAMEDADVVVLNTCCIRENADQRLYGTLGRLKELVDAKPGLQIAVGRLPGPEGPRAHPGEGGLGRRGVRHAQPEPRRRCCCAGPATRAR